MAEFIKLGHLEVKALLSMLDAVSDIRELDANETAARAKLELIQLNQERSGRAKLSRRHSDERVN